jgi:hypothetical protein
MWSPLPNRQRLLMRDVEGGPSEDMRNPGVRSTDPAERAHSQDLPSLLMDGLRPDLPEVYATLLSRSRELSLAAWRVRLAGLHLSPDALLSMDRIRVVVGELDGQRLAAEAEGMALSAHRSGTVQALLKLLMEDRLLVRAAPLGGWSPDFSLFLGERTSTTLLLGPHWLERPFPHRGPALASLHSGPEVARVEGRFEELWEGAHDVKAAVLRMLTEAARRGTEAAAP